MSSSGVSFVGQFQAGASFTLDQSSRTYQQRRVIYTANGIPCFLLQPHVRRILLAEKSTAAPSTLAAWTPRTICFFPRASNKQVHLARVPSVLPVAQQVSQPTKRPGQLARDRYAPCTTSMLAPSARTALALLLLNQLRARNRSLPCFRNILCHRLCRALTCPPSVLQPGSEIAPPSSRQLLAFQNSISHHNSLFPAQVRLVSRFVGGILTMRSPARLTLKKRSDSQRLRSRAMVKTLIANSRQPR